MLKPAATRDVLRRITGSDVQPCREPCPECPFKRTSDQGNIGPHKHSSEILDIVHRDGKFPCHLLRNAVQRLQRTDDVTAIELSPHCVGSLAYRNNTCKLGSDPQMQQEMDAVGRRDDVFADPIEMQLHHDGEAAYVGLPGMPRQLLPPETVTQWQQRRKEAAERAKDSQRRSDPPPRGVGKVRRVGGRPRPRGQRKQ